MRKDPTEFRERFAKWKAGEKVYEKGLPKYGDGTTNVIPEDLQGLSDPQFQPQIDAAKVQMTPFVVDDTAYRAQKYHPGVTREQVQELYNNTPYIGSYNKGMLARPSVGAYFSDRDDYPFVRIGQNKPYSVKQMIAHESGHVLDRKLLGGRTKEERDTVRAAYGNIPGMTDDEMFQVNREIRQAISENNRNVIKEKLDAVLKEIKDKDINWTIKNGKFGHADEAYKANIDPEAVRKALLEVAQNKYTFDKGNGIMLAKNGKSAVLPAYGGGKSTKKGPYVKGVVSKPVYDEFDSFLQTLPDNQRALGAYNTRRYWELNGKPKDFAEAIGKGMYSVKNDNGVLGWHANSVVYNEDNDTYEFMKPNYHPTRWMEQVYGYDQSPEFQKDWKVQYNGPMLSDRYVRREKPGLKIVGGQLPGYKGGKGQYDHTVNFLKQYEGFKDTTYLDGNGVPTIGYGFTDSSLVKKGRISKSEADRQLVREIEKREDRLSKLKNWNNLSEDSKTALRSYYYNYPAGFGKDTKFIRYWNAGDYERAINEVDAGMNDKNNPGLRKRRLQEQKMLRQDPFLKTPVRSQIGPVEQMMDNSPRFIPQPVIVPATIQPDYGIQTMVDKSIPAMLNSRNSGDSPIYGGNDYSFRMPNLKEYIERNLMRPQW